MSEKDISIIIPVYNGLPYFKKCLDRLMAQTYDHEKIEVLIVNNGSTDGSGDVAESYAKQDSMFKVFHQENSGGPASPRNRGIDNASGEYLFFHDADDYMGEEAVEKMLLHAREWNSDALCPMQGQTNRHGFGGSMYRRNLPKADVYTSTVARTLGVWKMYKRSMLIENDIRFGEDLYWEDTPFTLEAFLCSNIISVAADYEYYYCITRDDGNNLSVSTSDLVGNSYKNAENISNTALQLAFLITNYADRDLARMNILPKIYNFICNLVLEMIRGLGIEGNEVYFEKIKTALKEIYYEDIDTDFTKVKEIMILSSLLRCSNDYSLIKNISEANFEQQNYRFDIIDNRIMCFYGLNETVKKDIPFDITGCFKSDYLLSNIEWQEDGVVLQGSMFLPPAKVVPELRIVVSPNGEYDYATSIPLKVSFAEERKLIEGIEAHEYKFEGVVSFKTLEDARIDYAQNNLFFEDRAIRWDISLALAGSSRLFRVGSKRQPGVFYNFIEGSAITDAFMVVPHENLSHKNISLIQFPKDSNVSEEPFVKAQRRYPKNSLLLQALRSSDNKMAEDISKSSFSAPSFSFDYFQEGVKCIFTASDGRVASIVLKEGNSMGCELTPFSAKKGILTVEGILRFQKPPTLLYSNLVLVRRVGSGESQIVIPINTIKSETNDNCFNWSAEVAIESLMGMNKDLRDRVGYRFYLDICDEGLRDMKLVAGMGNFERLDDRFMKKIKPAELVVDIAKKSGVEHPMLLIKTPFMKRVISRFSK